MILRWALLLGLLVVFGQAARAASSTNTLPDDARAFEARCSRAWNADCEAEAQRLNALLQERAIDLPSYYRKQVTIPVLYTSAHLSMIREKLKEFDEEFTEGCVGSWAIGCSELSLVRNILSISEMIVNGTMLGQEAEAERIADEKAADDKRIAEAKAAEERRIAREEARERRQWTLIAIVGGMLVALLGVFAALRAFGVSASIAEWSRSFYWLTRAAVVLTFALFFLTAVETIFGSLTIPDWMRRPLAEMLNKASDAIDPEVEAEK